MSYNASSVAKNSKMEMFIWLQVIRPVSVVGVAFPHMAHGRGVCLDMSTPRAHSSFVYPPAWQFSRLGISHTNNNMNGGFRGLPIGIVTSWITSVGF